jgi:excisionase family DNA binding protein
METTETPLTLTVEQAAEALGISRGLAYQAVREGAIPSVRIGRRVVVPRARLLDLMGAQAEVPADRVTGGEEQPESQS